MEKIRIERTKKGLPAMWEQGGGRTNTGEATIIADSQGNPKRPVYICKRGHLANAKHALFIVKVGDIIIEANHHREDFEIIISKIIKLTNEKKTKYYQGKKIIELTKEEFKEKYGKDWKDLYKVSEIYLGLKDLDLNGINEKLTARLYNYDGGKIHIYEKVAEEEIENYAEVEQLYEYSMGEWNIEPPKELQAAIEVAMEKATCYHCREPHYIVE